MPIKIAIDGPAGTGKSTIARMVAGRLGIPLLNSGQLYRAVAYIMLLNGEDLTDATHAAAVAESIHPKVEGGLVVNAAGLDVRGRLDTDEISASASVVAKHPGVRAVVVQIQKDYASRHGAVMEGRAIGTVVMPGADVKIFLTCDPAERVRRRARDGSKETVDELLKRDRQDSERAADPLRKAEDAIEIDTTNLTAEQVTELIIKEVR